MRVLPLFSFKIMEQELYSSHNVLIFCDMSGWFFSPKSLKAVNSVLRYYRLAGFVNGSIYFRILISMDNFKDNFPSSFLAATFGHC